MGWSVSWEVMIGESGVDDDDESGILDSMARFNTGVL